MDLEMESDGTRDEFRCITYKYVAFKIRNGKMFGEQTFVVIEPEGRISKMLSSNLLLDTYP